MLCLLLLFAGGAAAEEQQVSEEAQASSVEEEALFYGVIGKSMTVYKWGAEDAAVLGKIDEGTVVDVYKKGRKWTAIAFEGRKGYVNTKYVELVQRKDPFQGPMPGTSEPMSPSAMC